MQTSHKLSIKARFTSSIYMDVHVQSNHNFGRLMGKSVSSRFSPTLILQCLSLSSMQLLMSEFSNVQDPGWRLSSLQVSMISACLSSFSILRPPKRHFRGLHAWPQTNLDYAKEIFQFCQVFAWINTESRPFSPWFTLAGSLQSRTRNCERFFCKSS